LSNQEADVTRIAANRFRKLLAYVQASGTTATKTGVKLLRSNNLSERDPKLVATVLEDFMIQSDFSGPIAVGTLAARWADVVGEEIAAHVSMGEFDAETKTLNLITDSTAWATQIRMLVPNILQKIAEEIGSGQVLDLSVNGPKGPSWKHGKRRVPGRGPRDTYG
jgi:predicted nucleic acid-binding Zn ribbon protein